MGNYGIKVSNDGYDIDSATIKQLALSSQYPLLKAWVQGSFSSSVTGNGTYTTTITHNLGTTDVVVSVRDQTNDEHVVTDVDTFLANSLHIQGNLATGVNYTVTVIG